MSLNFDVLAWMLCIHSLHPLMHLWQEVLVMIDLMMLYNLGRLICQLILWRVHLETLIGNRDRHMLL